MLILAVSLPLVQIMNEGWLFLLPAVMMGLAQALIFPAAIALVSNHIRRDNLGAGMGLIGMMQNFGKVAGPVLGGLAIQTFGYESTLLLLSAMLMIGMVIIWQVFASRPKFKRGAASL